MEGEIVAALQLEVETVLTWWEQTELFMRCHRVANGCVHLRRKHFLKYFKYITLMSPTINRPCT